MYITNSLLTEFDQELHDRCTMEYGYEQGVADGRASGIAEGAQQNAIANAISFFKNGVSVEIISKSLGMSIEQIREITSNTASMQHR